MAPTPQIPILSDTDVEVLRTILDVRAANSPYRHDVYDTTLMLCPGVADLLRNAKRSTIRRAGPSLQQSLESAFLVSPRRKKEYLARKRVRHRIPDLKGLEGSGL